MLMQMLIHESAREPNEKESACILLLHIPEVMQKLYLNSPKDFAHQCE